MKIFLSYTRTKDLFQKVSAFRERLEAEIGIRVPGSKVFQDKEHIQEGDHFPEVLTTELAKSDILLVLVSPAWLQSEWCRREFALFTDAGANTNRVHRILPVLWVDTPDMHNESHDSVARTLASINYADWRNLRYKSWAASQKEIGRLADRAVSLVQAYGQSWQADSPAPAAATGKTTPQPAPPESIYSDIVVSVTTERVIISGTTYALRNITSVKMTDNPAAEEGFPLVLIVVGTLGVFVSFGVFAHDVGSGFIWLVISGGVIAMGIFSRSFKPSYNVTIATSSGEIRALTSKNKDYIAKIVDAINEAVVRYR